MSTTASKPRWYAATITKALPGITSTWHTYARVGSVVYVKRNTTSMGGVVVFSGSHHQHARHLSVEQAREHLRLGARQSAERHADIQDQLEWSLST